MRPVLRTSPFTIAFVSATLLVGGLSLLLYLNEDLRRIALDMVEETVDEEGNVVRRVNVDRPEPSPRQVKDLAREREEKRREDLREQARKIRESVLGIAEGVEARLDALENPGEWGRLAALAMELRGESFVTFRTVRHTHIHYLPETQSTATRVRNTADNHAHEMRLVALADAVPPATVQDRLAEARAILEDAGLLLDQVSTGIAGREEGRSKDIMARRIPEFEAFQEQAVLYLQALERMEAGKTFVDMPDTEPVPSESGEEEASADLEHFRALMERMPSEEALENMSTAELYRQIQDLAEVADELFAENLAAELADYRKIPLEDAREHVHKPRTDTGPDLQEALGRNDPASRDEFREFNEALGAAGDAAARMARTAETRRERVRGDAETKQDQSADQLQSALQRGRQAQAEMTRAAQATQGTGNVTDLRAAMGQAYGLSGQGGGSGEGHSGGHSSAFGPGGQSGGGDQSIAMRRGEVFSRAVPGRRLDMNSSRQGWIFLDTWYIIGPWSRPRVDSFETIFPPEIDVDLDATYEGKLHPATREPIELKWRFVQSENVRINPPDETTDAVYYAYTELYSETAMDVLLAIGADDSSKVWINDLVVYQDNALSGWRPDEGFRRVLLKPGYNKVLVRLENGPSVTYFSVIVCPDDVLSR